jgi:pilus assembly protein CpaB
MANRRNNSDSVETTPIYVALTDISMGDPLTLQMVKLEEWPKDKIQPGALSKVEEIEGRRCRSKIFAGEPILERKLLAKGETGANATDLIPKGWRVVAVHVDAVSSSSGLILPGDRVDALVHVREDRSRGIPASLTRIFLQNIKVFAVDDQFDRDKDGETAIVAKTISLLVTPEQAELVMFATKLGEVQLVMRSANDDEQVETEGAGADVLISGKSEVGSGGRSSPRTPGDLLNMIKQQAAEPEPKPQPVAVAVPAAPRSFKVTVIRGSTVENLEFPHPEEQDAEGDANAEDEQPSTSSKANAGPKVAEPANEESSESSD